MVPDSNAWRTDRAEYAYPAAPEEKGRGIGGSAGQRAAGPRGGELRDRPGRGERPGSRGGRGWGDEPGWGDDGCPGDARYGGNGRRKGWDDWGTSGTEDTEGGLWRDDASHPGSDSDGSHGSTGDGDADGPSRGDGVGDRRERGRDQDRAGGWGDGPNRDSGRRGGGGPRGRRRSGGFGEHSGRPQDGGSPSSSRAEEGKAPGDPAERARAICLRLLTGTPRTRKQLADALRKREIPEEVAEEVLSRFEEVGLIDDSAFADAWVESRHHGRGLARRALARELRTKGVDSALIEEAVGQLDSEQEEITARELVARKLRSTRGLDRDKRLRRLAGMLARKGYSEGLALRVVRQALEEEGEDTDGLEGEGF